MGVTRDHRVRAESRAALLTVAYSRSMALPSSSLHGLTVFERGWLSSNNVLIHGRGAGATLVDTSHSLHAGQTVALVRRALAQAQPHEGLVRVINTHLHSDHCGGNAALQREFGAELLIPPGLWGAVQRWDENALSYRATGQYCERFTAQRQIAPGEALELGGRNWQVFAAPGHDPDSVILFEPAHGVLISADALWENGYGLVFPELAGEPGFDDVETALDLIAALPVRCVIPGHGAPFADCAGALARARRLLAKQRADPAQHARHATKVLIKYHLMEERAMPWPDLSAWAGARPMFVRAFHDQGARGGSSLQAWCETLVHELAERGAVTIRDQVVYDA
jgi:glyoxylase-like metal-dependent hydrolase (beta-lactamase superfamily II)